MALERRFMPEKIIRDPVHDVIAFQIEQPVDALLFRLVNAAEVQRLRRIRQLGMAHLAYPGADHSRYSHSIGVMETARRMLDHLGRGHAIDEQGRLLCLIGALLHDIGHGPFSHVFERVSGIQHEPLGQQIILDPDSEVHLVLADHEPELPERVVAFLRCQPARTFFSDVIASQLDADRLDYLLRDDLMTGSRYGAYDLHWLLHALEIDEAGDRLAVGWKGVSAVEAYLQARYHMYRNVYFHKVVRSAEGMVHLALRRAQALAMKKTLEWPPPRSDLFRALTGQRLTMSGFLDLDDVSVWHALKVWAKSNDTVLARLCHGLLFRNVYKTIDVTHSAVDQVTLMRKAAGAVTAAGGDGECDLLSDEPADAPSGGYRLDDEAGRGILVRDAAGRLAPLAELSPLEAALNQQLRFRRIHVAEPYLRQVVQAVGG
jgi:hypothetical protein